jgi:pseudouridine-5'-phosphate glycosidase
MSSQIPSISDNINKWALEANKLHAKQGDATACLTKKSSIIQTNSDTLSNDLKYIFNNTSKWTKIAAEIQKVAEHKEKNQRKSIKRQKTSTDE